MSTLDYFSLGHPLTRFRSHFAVRARRRMFELFMQLLQPTAADRVLDLGVTPDTTLAESNLFEALYPHRARLVAASIEDASGLERHFPGLRCVRIEPGPLPFKDDEFDILFCSAVLEHVGTREQQAAFLAECLRVSRRVFLTTPNKGFPVDFHTFLPLLHWLPQRWHQASLRVLGQEFLSHTENLNLVGVADLASLYPRESSWQLHRIPLLGLTSNLVLVGQRQPANS
jgi:SAM-dependent methyltransferase